MSDTEDSTGELSHVVQEIEDRIQIQHVLEKKNEGEKATWHAGVAEGYEGALGLIQSEEEVVISGVSDETFEVVKELLTEGGIKSEVIRRE